jgi:hypothetical protein
LRFTSLALAALIAAGPMSASAAEVSSGLDPVRLDEDETQTIEGVPVACTGVGETRRDPRWRRYSVRIEVSDQHAEYLSGGDITVADAAGRPMFRVLCSDPWLLVDLEPGRYQVRGRIMGIPVAGARTANVIAPARGQARVVLQFNVPPISN